MLPLMTQLRIGQVAGLLGVSDDTVRRWADAGRLPAGVDATGRRVVDGAELAAFVREQHRPRLQLSPSAALRRPSAPLAAAGRGSARNRLTGIVTEVVREGVMAQVELQAGPFRLVSLMTREAADELGLAPGTVASAVVKATAVTVELER
jgi:molybdopterin-binding protein